MFRYTITPGSDRNSNNQSSNSKSNSSKNGAEVPAIRVKARYQTVEILELSCYSRLLKFVQSNYLPLCLVLEPVLGVKAKVTFFVCYLKI